MHAGAAVNIWAAIWRPLRLLLLAFSHRIAALLEHSVAALAVNSFVRRRCASSNNRSE
jgi:hypothetical protein